MLPFRDIAAAGPYTDSFPQNLKTCRAIFTSPLRKHQTYNSIYATATAQREAALFSTRVGTF